MKSCHRTQRYTLEAVAPSNYQSTRDNGTNTVNGTASDERASTSSSMAGCCPGMIPQSIVISKSR